MILWMFTSKILVWSAVVLTQNFWVRLRVKNIRDEFKMGGDKVLGFFPSFFHRPFPRGTPTPDIPVQTSRDTQRDAQNTIIDPKNYGTITNSFLLTVTLTVLLTAAKSVNSGLKKDCPTLASSPCRIQASPSEGRILSLSHLCRIWSSAWKSRSPRT